VIRVLKKITKLCNNTDIQTFLQHKVRPILSWRPYGLMDTMVDVLVLREPQHVLLNVDLEPPAEERLSLYEASLYELHGSYLVQILMELDNLEDARQVCVCCILICLFFFLFNTFSFTPCLFSYQFLNVGQRVFNAYMGKIHADEKEVHRAYILQHLPFLRFFFFFFLFQPFCFDIGFICLFIYLL
jgi:hypothetical protein